MRWQRRNVPYLENNLLFRNTNRRAQTLSMAFAGILCTIRQEALSRQRDGQDNSPAKNQRSRGNTLPPLIPRSFFYEQSPHSASPSSAPKAWHTNSSPRTTWESHPSTFHT